MILLSEWFQLNTRRPLALAGAMVLALWCSVAVKSYQEVENNQRSGFTQLLDVTALAMSQKNRMLIESILHTAQTQTHASSVAICQGDTPLLSSNLNKQSCREQAGFFVRILQQQIPGSADYTLTMTFPRIAVATEQIVLLGMGMALMAVTLFILRRVQLKFTEEVVGPLKDGIFGTKSLNIVEFEDLRQVHHDVQTAKTSVAVADAVLAVTKQVSHDIRSPLSALNMVVSSLKELPEEKRLIIRNAAQRINDIANSLLRQSNLPLANTSGDAMTAIADEPVMLVALLDSIVSEKRVQYRERMDVEIQGDLNQGYGLFAKVNASEFSRAISNLVNNSVEAFSGPGRATVSIRGSRDQIAVTISDNGRGIPAEILARIGKRGFSQGKESNPQSGSGLGVYHARETVEHAGGKLSIQSRTDVGTMVSLTVPRAETPQWFVKKITLPSDSVIVSVDDDQTIHQIFAGRLASAGANSARTKHIMFSSMEQFETWISTNWPSESHFLIDYEFLGQTENGLDLIERTGIKERAILVTSRYEEPHIRSRADALGVRILPKTLAPFVPLTIESSREKFDAVLIDDDSLVHMTWQMAAQGKGRRLLCLSTPEEFWTRAYEIALSSPIYVDVNLGADMRGEEIARKIIALGFTEVFLATGYATDSVDIPTGVRAQVGKDPMF